MRFPTPTEYALENTHKKGDLVQLNQHTNPNDPVYEITRVEIHKQFAYAIRENLSKKPMTQALWQHYQLVAVTQETNPEYFL